MSTPNPFELPSDLSAGGPAPSAPLANLTVSPAAPYTLTGSLTVENLTFQNGGVMTVTGDAVLVAENIVLQGAAAGPQILIIGAPGEAGPYGQRGIEGWPAANSASGTCNWFGGVGNQPQTGFNGSAGGSGVNGQPGTAGAQAPAFKLNVRNVTGGILQIVSRGGAGGAGGSGGDGANGSEGGRGGNGVRCALGSAPGGNGGAGGPGGNGGNGGPGGPGGSSGIVQVACVNPQSVRVTLEPGPGGIGGHGGMSGRGGQGGAGGSGPAGNGSSGPNSAAGLYGANGPAGPAGAPGVPAKITPLASA